MSEARSFSKLAEVGELVAIACTPDGSLVAVNDADGRVWFYAVDPSEHPLEPLPLRFSLAEVGGVLLHPDGQVISYRCDEQLVVDIHDPHSGALRRSMVIGPVERDELDDDDDFPEDYDPDEQPSVAEGFHFDVAILERPAKLDKTMPLQIANARRDAPVEWLSELPDVDIWPNRFTRMALHPNRRWLAVLDRATWILDLETGELLHTLGYRIDKASLFEYGEGTHTIGFDDRGLLTVASTAISGNPYLEIDRVDLESGARESTTETWRQRWGDPEGASELEVHVYDPTTHFPPELIPAGSYKVLFRRCGIEVWSQRGLVRGVPVSARTCVIPIFDPASFCADPRALLVTAEGIELLDLVTGERSLRRPPIDELRQISRLTHIEFDAPRGRVLLWRERSALLAAPITDDHWSVCELPEGRRMRDWAFAGEPGRAFVVDDAGDLWLADVDPEPRPTPRAQPSLHALERELLANPHDPAPFLIYADALNDRGDPRGELIMLHHQRAFDPGHALIQRHRHALIGPLAELAPNSFDLRWERGFVRSAKFSISYGELDRVLGFLASDAARLIESVELRMRPRSNSDDVVAGYLQIDAYLAAARHLPWLRSLRLGERGQHSPSAELRAGFPRLE